MKIDGSLLINASAERVWQVIAHEFADIGHWASSIQESTPNTNATLLDGAPIAGRVCHVQGFDTIQEVFTSYSDENKTFTYEATGMPFFVTSARNRWIITPIDTNTTQAQFFGELELLPIIGLILSIPMRLQLKSAVNNTIEELKHYIETDTVHPRKAKLMTHQLQGI